MSSQIPCQVFRVSGIRGRRTGGRGEENKTGSFRDCFMFYMFYLCYYYYYLYKVALESSALVTKHPMFENVLNRFVPAPASKHTVYPIQPTESHLHGTTENRKNVRHAVPYSEWFKSGFGQSRHREKHTTRELSRGFQGPN